MSKTILKPVLLALWALVSLGSAQNLEIVFTAEDRAALESLVTLAQGNDPLVLERRQSLAQSEYDLSIPGRLTEALSVNAGTGLTGDFYGQAAPSFSVSVSVDVMELVKREDTSLMSAQVSDALETARLKTVEAFVAYKVALESAEASARALEAAEASLKVVQVRVEAGAEVAAAQIGAQSAVADAAINLLRANGNVIVALERLASIVGATPERTAQMAGGEVLASR